MEYHYGVAKPIADAVCAAVASLLREKREALGLSMYAVAKRAQISHTTMTRIENGLMKPTLDMLLRIAGAMGIALWRLIREAEEKQVGTVNLDEKKPGKSHKPKTARSQKKPA